MADGQQVSPEPAQGDDPDKSTNPAATEDVATTPGQDANGAAAMGQDEIGEKGRRTERRRARKQAQLNSTSGALDTEGDAPKGVDGKLPARLSRIRGVMKSAVAIKTAGPAQELKRYVMNDGRCRGSERKVSCLLHQALVSCAIPFHCCGDRAGNANARLRAHV